MARGTRGVHDVIRYNASNLRRFMSDPQSDILILGSNNTLQKRPLPKTYDLIIKLSLIQKMGLFKPNEEQKTEYTVTCNKDEILRIEKNKNSSV